MLEVRAKEEERNTVLKKEVVMIQRKVMVGDPLHRTCFVDKLDVGHERYFSTLCD